MAIVSTGQNLQRLGYRRIVQLLIYLVIIPTVLLLTLGFVLMFIGEGSINLLLGILTVTFVSVVVTGVILVLVFVRREANLSELQADFVSKVSHELRTPLTAIRLFAETIERSRDDDKTVEQCLDLLLGECERLTGRIERLLDWGRMEAGRRFYHLRDQNVTEVFEHAVSAFSALRTDTIDFESELEPNLPMIHADRDALVDAVVNLLSNAHKYGGTPPVVRLRAFASATGGVAISVTDNGPGIARPEHRRIFQKFYRIDDRLSREREGSGLGLAIVKHVVRAHRGRIVLESEPGKGSTFTLVLPTPRPSRKRRARGARAEDAEDAKSAKERPEAGVSG